MSKNSSFDLSLQILDALHEYNKYYDRYTTWFSVSVALILTGMFTTILVFIAPLNEQESTILGFLLITVGISLLITLLTTRHLYKRCKAIQETVVTLKDARDKM